MASELLDALVTRVDAIHRRTIEHLAEIQLTERSVNPDSDVRDTVADPAPAQQRQLLVRAEALRRWRAVAEVFLERSYPEAVDPFRDDAMLLMSYVLMERSGRNIDHHLWKELFGRESTFVVARLTALLDQYRDAFEISGPLEYSDLEVSIEPDGAGWRLEGRGELGSARAEGLPADHFTFGISESELDMIALSETGERIFSSLFVGNVASLFERCRERATAQNRGLRVRLQLGQAEAAQAIPWEIMFDGRDFVALSFDSPLARQLDWLPSAPRREVEHPLRILVTIAQPAGVAALDSERERTLIEQALAPLISLGVVRLDFTPNGTLQSVERALRAGMAGRRPHHVWHFIGHGSDKNNGHESQLIFEASDGSACPVSGFELGALLGNERSLGLVVLNACHSGAGDIGQTGVIGGVSRSLLDRGVSAVVAMRDVISDDAAVAFGQHFYEGLVDGLPVDAATTAGRRAIFFGGNQREWTTPVTFVRHAPGTIFDWRDRAWEVGLGDLD